MSWSVLVSRQDSCVQGDLAQAGAVWLLFCFLGIPKRVCFENRIACYVLLLLRNPL